MQGASIIRKLGKILPRNSLITIYKSFVKLHLDYGNILSVLKKTAGQRSLIFIKGLLTAEKLC